mgnify:CR=1 FL=1|jgi:acyl-coenzyme A synthetase/AMP-(fatty) acid ligase
MFLPLSLLLTEGREPGHVVAIREGKDLTFEKFQKDVFDLSFKLQVGSCEPVILTAKDSYVFAVGFLALLHAGRLIVLPQNDQPKTLCSLKQKGFQLLQDGVYESTGAEISCSKVPGVKSPKILDASVCELEFYTSGSTGAPKKICKKLDQLENEINILEDYWGDISQDVVVATVSHQHIYGMLFKVLWPLCSGRPFDTSILKTWGSLQPRLEKGCMIVSSPSHLSRFPEAFQVEDKQFPSIVFSSGGPLSYSAAQKAVLHLGCLPMEIFGSTETGGIAYRQQNIDKTPWTPFKVVEVGQEEGALRVRSPYLSSENWYKTNDLISILINGQFILKGRNDRIVKVEGKRVSLLQIEIFFVNHSLVEDTSVLILEDERKSLACIVVLNENGESLRAKLGDFRFCRKLRDELSEWFELESLPRRWRFVKQVPENSQGKRVYEELCALFD